MAPACATHCHADSAHFKLAPYAPKVPAAVTSACDSTVPVPSERHARMQPDGKLSPSGCSTGLAQTGT